MKTQTFSCRLSLILFSIIVLTSCEKEQSLTPNPDFLNPSQTNQGSNNNGNNGSSNSQFTNERYIIANVDGNDISYVRNGDIFDFEQPNYSRYNSMSCSGDCTGSLGTGMLEKGSFKGLEIEFYQTYSEKPEEQEIIDRIKVQNYNFMSGVSGASAIGIDSIIIIYNDGTTEWKSDVGSISAQSGSKFSLTEVITYSTSSNVAFEYEKDAAFVEFRPSLIIRGKFNCNLYDNAGNKIIVKDAFFSLGLETD